MKWPWEAFAQKKELPAIQKLDELIEFTLIYKGKPIFLITTFDAMTFWAYCPTIQQFIIVNRK